MPAVTYVNPAFTHAQVPRLIDGTQYEFRVMAENLQGVSEPIATAKPVVAKSQFGKSIREYLRTERCERCFFFLFAVGFYDAVVDVPGKPSKPDAVEVDKDHIKLKWMPPISNGGSSIIGYDVERREVLSGRWLKLTKSPMKVRTIRVCTQPSTGARGKI